MTSEVAGKSGSVRVASLKIRDLKKMQNHEKRMDVSGQNRHVRDVAPLVYSDCQIAIAPPPDEDGAMWGSTLVHDYERHIAGARRNKGADAVALHAFVQFPTDLIEMDEQNERRILQAAVDFINKTHGGDAVFHARLDRDEVGRHGVDVFFAPTYEKQSKSKPQGEKWVSLTKFGKSLALSKYGQNSPAFQGRALQDAFFEFLSNDFCIEGIKRGSKKLTKDKDRVDPEVYKLNKDRENLSKEKEGFKKYVSQYHDVLRDEKHKLAREKKQLDSDRRQIDREKKDLEKSKNRDLALRYSLDQYFSGYLGCELKDGIINLEVKGINQDHNDKMHHALDVDGDFIAKSIEFFQKILDKMGLDASLMNKIKKNVLPELKNRPTRGGLDL